MLKSLHIENFVLIDKLDFTPDQALNVITGETGAGKSLLIGALGLLQGERADSKVLLNPENKCVVEGIFEVQHYELEEFFQESDIDYDDNCIIRRQIYPNGKSRAFINDVPVNLDILKKLSVRLMDIHSQHDTLLLGSNDYQLGIIDNYAGLQKPILAYKASYKVFREAEKKFQDLLKELSSLRKEDDYNKFLFNELETAQLDGVKQTELEQEVEKIDNLELVRQLVNDASTAMNAENGALDSLRLSQNALNKLSSYGSPYKGWHERLVSANLELKDIAKELEAEADNLFIDEAQATLVREKLDTIYVLCRKHNLQDLEQLIALRDELGQKVGRTKHSDAEARQAKIELEAAKRKVLEQANDLSAARQAVLDQMILQVNSMLSDLGMPNARLSIQLSQIPPSLSGVDKALFLFAANKGSSPQALKEVASGGEFSRLMLAIKNLVADKGALPTIIFDEIDTGVSGEVALKMGKIFNEMAKKHQLIAISHLPQIAAKGQAHYFVYKEDSPERTTSRIKKLTKEERVQEIAQMIGGTTPSPNTIKSAKELLGV
ncbi:MAG: DNA repair protein RecN [Cytophagales bacterium]|nr:MAG: DNA repair protein RecN [Cytophagales bacterium]TAF59902.1 MAG: DNA repair protein RecN [Cytophagales bacterium]